MKKRKVHRESGFTLAETLLATLILLMVSAIVATGVPVAKNAYEKVVLASNADVLLSTTISSLRNELGSAQDVEKVESESGTSESGEEGSTEEGEAGTILTYYNATRGASSKLYVDSTDHQGIMFQRYYSKDGLSKSYEASRLVSAETSTGDLYVTYDSVEYEDGIITFNNLSVNRESGAEGLAKRDTLSIRVISDE